MEIQEIMTRVVHVIAPEATVRDAAAKMDDENVGALPVCDRERLVGIVTDRDIVVRSTAAGQDPEHALVRDVMTAPVLYAFEDQAVEDAADLMRSNFMRRLPVLARANHQLVGIVSDDDLSLDVRDRAAILGEAADRGEPGQHVGA